MTTLPVGIVMVNSHHHRKNHHLGKNQDYYSIVVVDDLVQSSFVFLLGMNSSPLRHPVVVQRMTQMLAEASCWGGEDRWCHPRPIMDVKGHHFMRE